MKSVLDYLENSGIKNPKKIAVIEEEKQVTYEELINDSKVIASNLLKYNLFNKPIAVYMEKGIKTLEAFFGIVYSGNFYSLINTEFPVSRLVSMFNTLESNLIITNDDYYDFLMENFSDKTIILIDDLLKGNINLEELNVIRNKVIDCDPLYLNFTSGSTGTPKVVVVSHRSVIDFINNFTKVFDFNESDIIANQAPFDFDVSVKDIYSSICVGATLVIVPKPLFSSPAKLLDYLVDNKITTMVWAVSALCLITTFHGLDYKVPETVNKVLFSGEVMPLKHLKEWMNHLPNATFVNVYGPTEITCNCTYHIIDRSRDYEDKIPIGIPFDNERVILLDDNDKNSNIGEICVVGTALALGYYNNEEETNKRFTQNPLNKHYIEYIYRTGDLGEYKDGELYFNGRKDFQIKYQGHRIELEEIEKSLMDIENIERAVCIFDEKKNRLHCFYIGDIEVNDLIELLKVNLPQYMIPSNFHKVDNFPLTKNGKVDRKLLMEGSYGK